ncbi:hypothetical protein [Lederbergia graminis]|uniref:NADH dehydrogenase subunit 6 n=1 Tax=Lederbergia graminis TaxID=735518 RepID=A0ABW0LIC4_9BACI|nr:hypothetical protein [Paenibacillus bovis]
MKVLLFMILGVIMSVFAMMLGVTGLILLGGATFGVLLYIAFNMNNVKV